MHAMSSYCRRKCVARVLLALSMALATAEVHISQIRWGTTDAGMTEMD